MQCTSGNTKRQGTRPALVRLLASFAAVGIGSPALAMFEPPQTIPGGPAITATGDFDGDGDVDLVTAEVLIRNDGTGWFGDSEPHGATGRSVAAGDMDGDGDLDLIVGDGNVETVSIYLNDGTGTFAPSIIFPQNGYDVAVGDVDGDGHLDVVTTAGINFGDGTGWFSHGSPHPENMFQMSLVDIDGDTDLDIVGLSDWPLQVTVAVNDGAGSFVHSTMYGPDAVESIAVGDFDGDGDVDVVGTEEHELWTTGQKWLEFHLFRNFGDGYLFYEYSPMLDSSYPSSLYAWANDVTGADVNGDGVDDVILGYRTHDGYGGCGGGPTPFSPPGPSGCVSKIEAFISNSEGSGTVMHGWTYNTPGACLTTADFDDDGDLDLVASNTSSALVFANQTIDPLVCPADFDGDGAVAFGDLTQLLSAWGLCPGCPEDLDESGDVGFPDLTTLLGVWGACP